MLSALEARPASGDGLLMSGGSGKGFGLMEVALIGLAIYMLLKLFGRKRKDADTMPQYPEKNDQLRMPSGLFSNKPDEMGKNGQKTDRPASLGGFNWEMLASTPKPPEAASSSVSSATLSGTGLPSGFDQQEFLRGAKMAYQRLNESWDKRDVDDIARFATPGFILEIHEQFKKDPNPSVTEIMLVNASLLGLKIESGKETATVLFDVLLRENAKQSAPSSAKEIWCFTRASNSAETWKLDGIQQVQ
jgi:predicted lipid-binding transport protein (Tim44 family)